MLKRNASAHTFVVGRELMRDLDKLATRHDRSRSYFVRMALRQLLRAMAGQREEAVSPEPQHVR